MKGLTQKQREIVDFIESFIRSRQYSPSYREIQDHFGYSSLGTVYKHLKGLEKKGAVNSLKQARRSLSIPTASLQGDHTAELELPFIGQLIANEKIELFPQSQRLAVPQYLVKDPENTYLLRSRGDGLQEALIADGDILVVEAKREAVEGETVLVLTDQQIPLIRTYHPEGSYVRLSAIAEGHEPLFMQDDEFMIQGALISLLRICT